ncbi:MAG: hypothetical protein HZB92_05010 [Euryarchaeota archaeon]|nr:hypothetical protein [Euryarchaeota archaeon]
MIKKSTSPSVPPPLEILQRADISLQTLVLSILSWLIARYTIIHEEKKHTIYALMLYWYSSMPGCPQRANQIYNQLLQLNGIDLKKTANGRKKPKNKSRRLETALTDLVDMGVLSRNKLRYHFEVRLKKDWLADKILLEEMLKEIDHKLRLKVGGPVDGIFVEKEKVT